MPRPKAKIDVERIKALAQMQASNEEIARTCGIDRRTLERHYARELKEWKSEGLETIRFYQWKALKNGSQQIALKLGEIYLPEQHPRHKDIAYETKQPEISIKRIDPAETQVHSDERVLEPLPVQEAGTDEASLPL